MLKSFRFGLSFLLVMLTLTACKFEEVEFKGMSNYKVESIDLSGAIISLDARISNPNKYKIKIASSDLDMYLNGNKAGVAKLMDKVVLPRKSDMVHTFRIKAKFENALSLMSKVGRNPELELKGYIKGKVFGVGKKVPVEFKQRVTIPSM